MEGLARTAGVSLRRLQAVDGQALSDEDYNRMHPDVPHRRRMTKSEVACFLSHRKAWQEIGRMDAAYGAVFEDDIYFGSALREVLSQKSWIRPDMDLVKLDKATRKHVEFGEKVEIAPGLVARRLLSLHVGCGGYLISKAFAKKLLDKTATIREPIDHFLFNPDEGILKQANIWQVLPAPCIHQQFSSDIFLPENAELSSLQEVRQKTIKLYQKKGGVTSFLVRKIAKEVARPILSATSFCFKKAISPWRGTSWELVGFKKDI